MLSVLSVTYSPQHNNIGDTTRHDKLRTIIHELERGTQVIELEGRESLVDNTRVIHLWLVLFCLSYHEFVVLHH